MDQNVPKMKMFIDTFVPVTTCNLRCHYCYITQQRLFSNKLPTFKYRPEVVSKAITQDRLGGVCHFNICGGGETLLPPETTDYLRVILEQGHYIMVVTNGTVSRRFDEIVKFPKELLERLCFKFSYHYLEIKEKKWLDRFFCNIQKIRDAGCSFSLELPPDDELIPLINEIREFTHSKVGADCHVTVARNDASVHKNKPILTDLSQVDYKKAWMVFNSDMFDYKLSIFGKKRKEFCYAGAWSAYLNLETGLITQCYNNFTKPQNIFEDLNSPIKKVPVGRYCRQPHCYNGHAFLTLGVIPEHESIVYSRIRNKVPEKGNEWLNPKMKAFLSNKLKEANTEYSAMQKFWHRVRYFIPAHLSKLF